MVEPSSMQMEDFYRRVTRGEITKTSFQRFLDNPDWGLPDETGITYTVTVDYGLSLSEMIGGVEFFSWSDRITEDKAFPIIGEGLVETKIQLVHFDVFTDSQTVLNKLEERSLRAATLEELIALAARYDKVPRKYPIAALGSAYTSQNLVGPNNCEVPLIRRHDKGRKLELNHHEWWDRLFRFAAVPK